MTGTMATNQPATSVAVNPTLIANLGQHSARFELYEWRHASSILRHDFPNEFAELDALLAHFKFCKSQIVKGGGSKSSIASSLDSFLYAKGWVEKKFATAIQVDNVSTPSPTHSVDCFKNRIALEVEWNNKDPFFDRDLNNFRLLFDLRVISVGIIITRCDSLQGIFNSLDIGSSYGASTTHMSKLLPRISGGGGGGCPLLIVGIRDACYDADC